MFKNRILKKLSIGIASLALVCPLALGGIQANASRRSKTAAERIVPIRKRVNLRKNKRSNRNYPAPIATLENNIFQEKKILNSKNGKYYLRIYRNLLKNQQTNKKMLTNMKKNSSRQVKSHRKAQSNWSPFTYLNNGKYVNHDKLMFSRHDNAYVKVVPKTGIIAKEMRIGQPASHEKVIRTKVLKQGTRLHVSASGTSFAWELSNKALKNNVKPGRNVNYIWTY